MEEHSRSRSSYPYDSEERRDTALPSLNVSLQSRDSYPAELAGGAGGARQVTQLPGGYTHPGTVAHTAYDPVHDAYDYPRIATPGVSQQSHGFLQAGYSRAERSDMYNYGGNDRFNNMDTLPPIRQSQHYEHSSQASTHAVNTMAHHSTAYPPRGDTGYQAYQMQPPARPSGSQFAPQSGMQEMSRGDNQTASYSSLPPLSIPGERPSSSDGKGGAKRIVMACHQCRNRKIRCDAGRPSCANCVRRREECQYDAKPRRRGPDKVPGSRMRSCKSRKQGMGEESPSTTSPGFQSPSSATFFPNP